MKIIASIFLFSIAFSVDEQDEIGFLYGILGHLGSNDDTSMVLQDSSIIHTGDEIRINAGYKKDTHFYVIYQGSEGEYMLLYPEERERVDHVSNLPDTIYTTILHWTKLTDPTGYETFFLINSSFVLEDLLSLMKRYDKVNAKGKVKLAKKIQFEIADLDPETKQDLASIGSRLDKPMVGGVAFRGDDGETLKDMSLTHSCNGEFGIAFKKIMLNHQ